MKRIKLDELLNQTTAAREEGHDAIRNAQNHIVTRMVRQANLEIEKIEHHLLEMSLFVIIYRWFTVRLKAQPWRLLVPASLAISILLQIFFSSFNILKFLAH
jgi:hypothetical protein